MSIVHDSSSRLHSRGVQCRVLLERKFALFHSFVESMVVNGIGILSLDPEDFKALDQPAQKFKLGFDDAYQYAVAEKFNLQLISFDKDFDRTDKKRKEPAEVVK